MRISFLVALLVLAIPASAAAAPKWTVRQLPAKPLEGSSVTDEALLSGVSCPSETLCVAVGALDTVAVSQSPTGVGTWWPIGTQ